MRKVQKYSNFTYKSLNKLLLIHFQFQETLNDLSYENSTSQITSELNNICTSDRIENEEKCIAINTTAVKELSTDPKVDVIEIIDEVGVPSESDKTVIEQNAREDNDKAGNEAFITDSLIQSLANPGLDHFSLL